MKSGGEEFAYYKDIEKIGIKFYLKNPYSAWQIREYCSKKTDLSKIDIKNLMEFNSRPRKCLDYQTPFDIFIHKLSLL